MPKPSLRGVVDRAEQPLTKRERDVLNLLAEGLTNQAIARRLGVERNTVLHHLQTVYRKLRVTNRVSAAMAWRDAYAPSVVSEPGVDVVLTAVRLQVPGEEPRWYIPLPGGEPRLAEALTGHR